MVREKRKKIRFHSGSGKSQSFVSGQGISKPHFKVRKIFKVAANYFINVFI